VHQDDIHAEVQHHIMAGTNRNKSIVEYSGGGLRASQGTSAEDGGCDGLLPC